MTVSDLAIYSMTRAAHGLSATAELLVRYKECPGQTDGIAVTLRCEV